MTARLEQNEMDILETMVDHASLIDVLTTLEQIAHAKADHLRSNWQDDKSAKVWEKDASRIAKLVWSMMK
jgi:hypothetical protein